MSDKPMHDAADTPHEPSASASDHLPDLLHRARTADDDTVNAILAREIAAVMYPETVGPVPRALGAVPNTVIMPRELARVVAGMYGNDVRVWKSDGEPRSPVPHICERTVHTSSANFVLERYTIADMAAVYPRSATGHPTSPATP